ncbi:MAG: hypothetical protein LBP75_09170 [Planctomycetota bacterium]|jgi:hypothetical protein|nr:hypothetical protein [Planctomycetota bacterium]
MDFSLTEKNWRELLRELHDDEGATVTVEWMMVITVALLVLGALYHLAIWAMNSTAETVKDIQGD